MAIKNKTTYKHGGKAEYKDLHDLSQKDYDKAVRKNYKGGGKMSSRYSSSYSHGGKFDRKQYD